MPNSPGYKAASDGYDMGADTSLPPIPTPDGGGNTPPPLSGSGGDSGGWSGGGGCGFVRDSNNKGPKAKGEGLAFAMMLIIALTGIALAKRRTGNITATKEGVLIMEIRKNSLIKIAAISFLLTIFWSASAYAQPQITSFSGTLSNGAALTITGNSFGANGPNILIFDDFESGTNGSIIKIGAGSATIGEWTSVTYINPTPPKYSNAHSLSGSLAFRGDATANSGDNNGSQTAAFKMGFTESDIFVSYWYYFPTTSDWPCLNNAQCGSKIVWVTGSGTSDDDRVIPADAPSSKSGIDNYFDLFCNDCVGGTPPLSPQLTMAKGKWYRFWVYLHAEYSPRVPASDHEELWVASPSGEANIAAATRRNITTQIWNTTFNGFNRVMINGFNRWCNDCAESAPTFDDVYVSIGTGARARVEIGDAATYATSKNLSIATVTSWSDTSITATVRQGSFGNLNNAYLYVIDAAGNVNTNGYLLSDGGGGNTPPPSSGGDTTLSGGDSSSGGSGCGFVKDNGKGKGAKGEGLTFAIMLIITLAGIAIVRKIAINKGSKGVERIKRMIYFSLFFFVIFCIPVFANAADYYVATNGNDSNPGTEAQPWQHIAYATCGGSYLCPVTTNNPNKLTVGDTLYVRGGTYNEYNIKFTNSGASGNPITIKGYPNEVAVVDAGFTAPDGLTTRAVFDIDGNHYITLDSLTIMRGQKANVRIGYNLSTTNITVRNCDIMNVNAYDNSGEIYVHPLTDNILIENNKLHGRGSLSQTIHGNGVHIFYAGNLIISVLPDDFGTTNLNLKLALPCY